MRTINQIHNIIILLIILAVVHITYVQLTATRETYTYHVTDLHSNSIIMNKHSNTYTNQIHASLLDTNHQKVGIVYSVNNHLIDDNINMVMGLVTYKTPGGTITSNIYYETSPDKHYLSGFIPDSKVEHESGIYAGKDVKCNIIGQTDGQRIVHITSRSKYFSLF